MALTIYGLHAYPNDIAVTKVGASLEDCAFLLDFSRPLERLRWFGKVNKLIGPTIALVVPVVHHAEQSGGYVISVRRGEPYFVDLPKLWRQHYGSKRGLVSPPAGGLDIVADFGLHFPEDC